MKRLHLLLLTLTLTLLTGCSSTRLVYNNADWLLRREIAKDTCPTDQQAEWLEQQVDKLHLWHRRNELPRYAQVLRRLARGMKPGLDPAEQDRALEAFFVALDAAVRRFGKRLAVPTGKYLSTLSRAQHQCMTRGMIRRYDKYAGAGKPEDRARKVRSAVRDRFFLYSKSERKLLRQWDEQNRGLTRVVARLMTPNQRTRLPRKLLKLAGELEQISRD